MKIVIATPCIAAAIMLSGCGAVPRDHATASTAMCDRAGSLTASLSGSAFITAMGGEAVNCAGNDVTLLPASCVATIANTGEDGSMPAPTTPANSAARHVTCDAAGRFTLEGLAVRNWVVKTPIIWEVPGKHGSLTRGGVLIREISLKPGVNTLVLSNGDLH